MAPAKKQPTLFSMWKKVPAPSNGSSSSSNTANRVPPPPKPSASTTSVKPVPAPAASPDVAASALSSSSRKTPTGMDAQPTPPPSTRKNVCAKEQQLTANTTAKASIQTPPASSPSIAPMDVDPDEEDEDDVVPLRRRTTTTQKRPSYFESGGESDDDGDAPGAYKVSSASSGKPVKRAKKSTVVDNDDFIVDDSFLDDDWAKDLEEDEPKETVMDTDSDDQAPRNKRTSKGKAKSKPTRPNVVDLSDDDQPAARKRVARAATEEEAELANGESGLAAFKMGAAEPSTRTSPNLARPAAPHKPKKSTSHLTKAERRVIENKEKKAANEQAYSFLRDLRDKDGNRPGEPEYDPRTLYIPKSAWKEFTPFEVQFWEIKQKHWDTVLFFQKGKFYELYEEDALIGHREFDLKLTDRVKMKMAGVPESSFEMYANKFLAQGYKVGRVDQCETAVAKGMRVGEKSRGGGSEIVRRELRHVLTGGTIVDSSCLPDDMSSFCISIKEQLHGQGLDETPTFGVCILDAATAEFRLTQFQDDVSRTRLETLLRSLRLKELIHEKGGLSQRTARVLRNTVPASCQTTMLKRLSEFLDEDTTLRKLNVLFNPDLAEQENVVLADVEPVEPSLLPEAISKMIDKPAAMSALGGLLWYLQQLNLDQDLCSSRNFDIFDPIRQDKCLVLDAQSLTHLNVLNNEQGGDEGTLHRLLNRCVTPFGKRLFKIWLVAPLASTKALEARHDAVDDFLRYTQFEDDFNGFAHKLPDIERIMPRIYAGKCKPSDFTRVLKSLASFDGTVERLLESTTDFATDVVADVLRAIPHVSERAKKLQGMFVLQEDGAFAPRRGVHEDYDEADDAITQIERDLEREKDKAAKSVNLQPKQVKWKHIGTKEIYQVEVPTKTKVPSEWQLMSTVKDSKRYYPKRVAELVQQLKEARETRLAALKDFHAELFTSFSADGPIFLAAVKGVAELDCLLSLAKASYAMGEPTCRPEFVECATALVDFKELRHPCMSSSSGADFIANDIALGGEEDEVVILTGGNMAGKSTTARTTATAVILAQMGCRVPATSARISPIDRIASRMGANDQIFRNNSTFMVEMLEASRIIKDCTPRSLVIMDELGRGTSTFDGQSIAYAVLHHLVGRTRCLSFFLTHYTSLAYDFASYPRVSNKHMQVLVDDDKREVVFTYRLIPGIAESSYGTQVAALAGVPISICDRAQSVSKEFMVASKELQAQRAQSSIPVATLADFAHLFRCAAVPQPATDDDEAQAEQATIVSQLNVIKAQVASLAARANQTEDVEMNEAGCKEQVPSGTTPIDTSPQLQRTHTIGYGGRAASRRQRQASSRSATPSTPTKAHHCALRSSASPSTSRMLSSPATSAPSSSPLSKPSATSNLKAGGKEQMRLDFGQPTTLTCGDCHLFYDRSDQKDVERHTNHHDYSTRGVEWSHKALLGAGREVGRKTLPSTVVKKLRGKAQEKMGDDEVVILSYDLDAPGRQAMVSLKLAELCGSIDRALDAAPLGDDARKGAKVLVGVSNLRGGRAVAAVVVGQTPESKATLVLPPGDPDAARTLNDGGDAIFVSVPLPANQTPPLAVHRIHVLPMLRRCGLAAALLDAALSQAVYGMSAKALEELCGGRAGTTAFSQPTEAGRRLAHGWIAKGSGEARLLVFGD